MKEFLIKRGVAFVSINVLEDKDAFAELAALGIRSVPIVVVALARLVGRRSETEPLQ